MRAARGWAVAAIAAATAACAANPAPVAPAGPPRYAEYPEPGVPPGVPAPPAALARHASAWQRLQAGDLRGAARDYSEVLRLAPGFYPAEAGLGFATLADGEHRQAAARFRAALGRDPAYVPALYGLAEAELSLGDDPAAAAALERLLAADPAREGVRARLEVVRLRLVQADLAAARRAREAGRLDEARAALEQALARSPASPPILLELAAVEAGRGAFEAAEAHARRAIALDDGDAEAHAALGHVLEAAGRYRDAADAYRRAAAIDADPAWRERSEALRARADLAALPEEYRALPSAASVTRAQAAAMIGLRLGRIVEAGAGRATVVATDVRGHWAAPWILPVTQAGVMEVYPNHTFQPGATLARSELARVVAALLGLLPDRAADVARWRAVRPRFADLPPAHVVYPAAALAVAAGAMTAGDGDRFQPTRPASGPELVAAIGRLEQLAGR